MFLILIAIEITLDVKRKTGYYRLNDAISSMQLGILSRVSGVLIGLIPFTFYVFFYQNFRLFDLPQEHYLVWALAFIGYDLVYYWVHRLSHRINIMWGSHVVHHSSEEYNLTTALRQTSTPAIFAWIIVSPLAIFGVAPELLVASASLNLVYQFWVHTRHVKKMPAWFEAVFVTPSHHRVHHALNRDYIDKNFAGVLILWDKIFGSFQEEKDDTPVVFGISSQLGSWNPIWANFQVYLNLFQDAKVTSGFFNKLKVLLSPPSYRSEEAKQQNPRKYITTKSMVKYEVSLNKGQQGYLLFQHIAILAMTFGWLLSLKSFDLAMLVSTCLFGIYTLFTISTLQENRAFSFVLEFVRLAITGVLLSYFLPSEFLYLTLAYSMLSAVWLYLAYGLSNDKGMVSNKEPQ
jgi:sterol desaturase/sphingolipid hydroxylase (fatty acid hydroxylase superfamily)